jgi:hypothetical protein
LKSFGLASCALPLSRQRHGRFYRVGCGCVPLSSWWGSLCVGPSAPRCAARRGPRASCGRARLGPPRCCVNGGKTLCCLRFAAKAPERRRIRVGAVWAARPLRMGFRSYSKTARARCAMLLFGRGTGPAVRGGHGGPSSTGPPAGSQRWPHTPGACREAVWAGLRQKGAQKPVRRVAVWRGGASVSGHGGRAARGVRARLPLGCRRGAAAANRAGFPGRAAPGRAPPNTGTPELQQNGTHTTRHVAVWKGRRVAVTSPPAFRREPARRDGCFGPTRPAPRSPAHLQASFLFFDFYFDSTPCEAAVRC